MGGADLSWNCAFKSSIDISEIPGFISKNKAKVTQVIYNCNTEGFSFHDTDGWDSPLPNKDLPLSDFSGVETQGHFYWEKLV